MNPAFPYILPVVQIMGGAAAMAAFALAPPDRGTMLFVPLTQGAMPVQAARTDGSALLGRGPLGSVIVRATHRRDPIALLRAGILVTAAPAAWCGAGRPA